MPKLVLSELEYLYNFTWKDKANMSALAPPNNQYNQSCLSSIN